mgnify:CR=1 FL=1
MTPSRRRPFCVGLLGGIGSGKSEAARLLAREGFRVFDADASARRHLARPAVLRRVERAFGIGARDARGRPDRRSIALAAFDSPRLLSALNRILHPLVRRDLARALARSPARSICILDVPLLLEAGFADACDFLAFVDAPLAARRRRFRARTGLDAGEHARRESRQAPLSAKRARADAVVANRGTVAALSRAVAALARRIRILAGATPPRRTARSCSARPPRGLRTGGRTRSRIRRRSSGRAARVPSRP